MNVYLTMPCNIFSNVEMCFRYFCYSFDSNVQYAVFHVCIYVNEWLKFKICPHKILNNLKKKKKTEVNCQT